MSSVSRPKLAASWQAHIRDADCKRINIATKIAPTLQLRGLAEQIAFFWEQIANKCHCREDIERQAEMLSRTISTRIKDATQSVVQHFKKKTKLLLDSAFPKETIPSFRDVSEEWLADKKIRVAASSYTAYCSQISEFISFLGTDADLPLNEFDRAWLRKFQSKQAERVSNKTVNKKVKCVCAMLRWAYKQEIIDENHADRIQHLPNQEGHKRRPFSTLEIEAILRVAPAEWKSMIRVGYGTGQRLGDISMMRWDDLDLKQGYWNLTTRKTGKPNSIPLIKEVWEMLEDTPTNKRGEFVHPKAANLYRHEHSNRSATLSNQFGNILCEAGLREDKVSRRKLKNGRNQKRDYCKLSFHSLRCTAATVLHENGVSQAIAQTILGHNSSDVHSLYVKPRPEPVREGVEKLSLFSPNNLKC